MRKLLNKLFLKFGYLITKAPDLLIEKSVDPTGMLPTALTEKITIKKTTDTPNNELYGIFATNTNVHKWHHYFDIYTHHFEPYRSEPIKILEIGVFRGGSLGMVEAVFSP